MNADDREREQERRRALIQSWTPHQRQLALNFLSTAAPEMFDLAAARRAEDEVPAGSEDR